MPRKARIVLPNTPHHIVQRGHNRQVVFVEKQDYQYYLANVQEWKATLGCKVYAFCLMTNHVHLIVDPGDDPDNLALLMKRVSARQTRMVNRLESRTGSLWKGRYKSSAIETDRYLLACCRYVELNPVRAGMVVGPADYPWSSYLARVGPKSMTWLDQDPCYIGLGENAVERRKRHAQWVDFGSSDAETKLFRAALQRGQLTGDQRFIDAVEARLGVRVEARGRGRPAGRTAGK